MLVQFIAKFDKIAVGEKTLGVTLICVSETWAHVSVTTDLYKMNGYNELANNRANKVDGRTTIYVQDNLPSRIINLLSLNLTPNDAFNTCSILMRD